jgi:hypothetical protein
MTAADCYLLSLLPVLPNLVSCFKILKFVYCFQSHKLSFYLEPPKLALYSRTLRLALSFKTLRLTPCIQTLALAFLGVCGLFSCFALFAIELASRVLTYVSAIALCTELFSL